MATVSLNRNPSNRDLRQFATIWFPAAAFLFGSMIWQRTGTATPTLVIWLVGLAVAIAGIVRISLVRPVFIVWTCGTYPIAWAISHAVLAIIYYMVITPIGAAWKMAGRDRLERRIDRSTQSYWKRRGTAPAPEAYFRQF